MIKEKIEPRLIDVEYINRELTRLFDSVPHGYSDELFSTYRGRFEREQKAKDGVTYATGTRITLSLAKKLEILCTYGSHKIVKMGKRVGVGHLNVDKSDNVAPK